MSSATELFSFAITQNIPSAPYNEAMRSYTSLESEPGGTASQFDTMLQEEIDHIPDDKEAFPGAATSKPGDDAKSVPDEEPKADHHDEYQEVRARKAEDAQGAVAEKEKKSTLTEEISDKASEQTALKEKINTVAVPLELSQSNEKQQIFPHGFRIQGGEKETRNLQGTHGEGANRIQTELNTKTQLIIPESNASLNLRSNTESDESHTSKPAAEALEESDGSPRHHAMQQRIKLDGTGQNGKGDFSSDQQEKTPYFFEQGNTHDEKNIHVFMPKFGLPRALETTSSNQSVTHLAQLRNLLGGELGAAIVRNASIQLSELQRGNIKLVLHPKELGQVHIALTMQEKRVVGRIWVDNSNVKQIIENQLTELEQSFFEKGIDLQSLEVFIRNDQRGEENFKQTFSHLDEETGFLTSDAVQEVYELDIMESELVNIIV